MTEPQFVSLRIEQLRPMQAVGVAFYEDYPMTPGRLATPVESLLYEGEIEDPEAVFLLLDGHHRAYQAHLLGRSAVPSWIFSQDEHISQITAPWLQKLSHIIKTIDDIKGMYQRVWLPEVERAGITSIDTMPCVTLPGRPRWLYKDF